MQDLQEKLPAPVEKTSFQIREVVMLAVRRVSRENDVSDEGGSNLRQAPGLHLSRQLATQHLYKDGLNLHSRSACPVREGNLEGFFGN